MIKVSTTLKLRRTGLLLLSILLFASSSILARLGVKVQNESNQEIAARIDYGINGWIKIEPKGKDNKPGSEFLPSESGKRRIYFYAADKNGKPKEDVVYYTTKKYTNPDLFVIKKYTNANDLECEITEAVLGFTKGEKKQKLTLDDGLENGSLDGANNTCLWKKSPAFTGIKVTNITGKKIRVTIDNSISPGDGWIELDDNKRQADLPSRPGPRKIYWQITSKDDKTEQDKIMRYDTGEKRYDMPHAITIMEIKDAPLDESTFKITHSVFRIETSGTSKGKDVTSSVAKKPLQLSGATKKHKSQASKTE
jgi:hypothetical protein